jgi:hypothetical protein
MSRPAKPGVYLREIRMGHGVLQPSIMERKEWQRGIVGRGKAEEAKFLTVAN